MMQNNGQRQHAMITANATASGQETKLSANGIPVVTTNVTEQICYWMMCSGWQAALWLQRALSSASEPALMQSDTPPSSEHRQQRSAES